MQTLYLAFLFIIYSTFQTFTRPKDSLSSAEVLAAILTDSTKKDSRKIDVSVIDTVSLKQQAHAADTFSRPYTVQNKDSSTSDSLQKIAAVKTIPADSAVKKMALTKGNTQKKRATVAACIKKSMRYLIRHIKQLLFLFLFLGVLFLIIYYQHRKLESRRFLTSTRLSVMDKEVQIACRYIERHYSDPFLSLDTLCEALVTGQAFLEALFHRELGMGVTDFIMQVRINHAKYLLAQKPDLSEEEITRLTGFTDYNQFLYTFMSITGIAFDDYRESLQSRKV